MVVYYSRTADDTHIFHHPASKSYLYVTGQDSYHVSDTLAAAYKDIALEPISCLLGLIRMKTNTYLAIADNHVVTGRVMGNNIARISSHRIIPLATRSHSSEEASYVSLLRQHLNNATLFFSIDNAYDLTTSLQLQFSGSLSPDSKFWWNQYMCEPLVAIPNSEPFVCPVIYGYFKSVSVPRAFGLQRSFDFALLTRRAVDRAGTRYFRRGIDDDGNVANFNETEQIFTSDQNHVYSLLQTRGSVPVYWLEINNLRYRPNLVIATKPLLDATAAHFKQQTQRYGDVVCVNLVNQKGYEEPVKAAYEKAIQNLSPDISSHVQYIYFDFHHECLKMRWDRVKLLLGHLEKMGVDSSNYFHCDLNTSQVFSRQTIVVRTNCMDCLDRTNVVQSVIAKWVLLHNLKSAGFAVDQEFRVSDPGFNLHFMNMWADNADAVSCAYSGTGALKTDYTRTGTRTRQGAFNDLINSISRYYQNNMSDGQRQDAYDLFLGNVRPREHFVGNPFVDRRPAYIQLLPYTVGTAMLIFTAIVAYPRGLLFEWKNLLVLVGCLAYTLRSANYVIKNGYQFVAWPKLGSVDFIKQVDEFDVDGKLVGSKYVERSDFVGVEKKKL